MGRGQGQADRQRAVTPRNILRVEYSCSACGGASTFDGHGAEWCPQCQTARHLISRERIYRLVELAPEEPAAEGLS